MHIMISVLENGVGTLLRFNSVFIKDSWQSLLFLIRLDSISRGLFPKENDEALGARVTCVTPIVLTVISLKGKFSKLLSLPLL